MQAPETIQLPEPRLPVHQPSRPGPAQQAAKRVALCGAEQPAPLVMELSSSDDDEHDQQGQAEDDFFDVSLNAAQLAPAGSRKRLWGSFDDGMQREAPSRRAYAMDSMFMQPRESARATSNAQGQPDFTQAYPPFGPLLQGSSGACNPLSPGVGVSPSRLLAPLMLEDHPGPMQPHNAHNAAHAHTSTAPNTDTALFGDSSQHISSRRAMLHQRLLSVQQRHSRDRAAEQQNQQPSHPALRGRSPYPHSMAPNPAEDMSLQRLHEEDKRHERLQTMQRRLAEFERDYAPSTSAMMSIRTPGSHPSAMEPPPPPPPRVPDAWRRTRSSRAPAPSGNNARQAWSTMAALEPLLPFSLMMDDMVPDYDEMDQALDQMLPSFPPPPDFRSRRNRGADDMGSGGPDGIAPTGFESRGRGSAADGMAEESGLRGALRQARAAYGAIPSGASGGGAGSGGSSVPWGMYRAGSRAAFVGMDERGGSPAAASARARHLGGWGAMPPGFGLGGVYGDLIAGAMRSGLPAHLLLSDRDFTPDDYEVLCRLDDTVENRKGATQQEIDSIPTQVVQAVPHPGQNKAQPDSAVSSKLIVTAAAAAEEPGEAKATAAAVPAAAVVCLPVASECLPGMGRCTICLDDWEEGSVVRRLSCAHCFHKDCVDVWLKQKASCPICQRSLRSTD